MSGTQGLKKVKLLYTPVDPTARHLPSWCISMADKEQPDLVQDTTPSSLRSMRIKLPSAPALSSRFPQPSANLTAAAAPCANPSQFRVFTSYHFPTTPDFKVKSRFPSE